MSRQFEPINDDHAIEQVVFTLSFERPFSNDELAAFRSNHNRWSEDLPAVRDAPGFTMVVGPDKSLKAEAAPGVEFAFVRPDGSAIWAMRVFGPEIAVECTRYSRWVRVWGAARNHLSTALTLLSERKVPNSLVRATLVVQDAFSSDEENYDLHQLFNASELLPASVFQRGANWHAHTGWFDQIGAGRILHNVNVDAVGGAPFEGPNGSKARVAILHLLSASREPANEIEAAQDRLGWLDATMPVLHDKNKLLMDTLLTRPLADRIGLEGRK